MLFKLMSKSFLLCLCFSSVSYAAYNDGVSGKIKYRTSFGNCPSKAAGTLTLKLVKEFESRRSLKDVKLKITRENLTQRHFISEYKINYNPIKNFLYFKFDCPTPLMKVQIYKNNGLESYDAILVDNGELYDPTYEVLLRSEKKLGYTLPFLALPVGDMNEQIQQDVTELIKGMRTELRKKLSEIILNEKRELTIILSINGHPSSVFIGSDMWSEKIIKLRKIVRYMEMKKKIPAIINLTNSKKVVVKFNDKI